MDLSAYRIAQEALNTGDNDLAVRRGQAATGQIITAVALIMICVFTACAYRRVRLGLAVAILLDALVGAHGPRTGGHAAVRQEELVSAQDGRPNPAPRLRRGPRRRAGRRRTGPRRPPADDQTLVLIDKRGA
ncbi:hypothetical protein [Streptomyces sp. MAR4 CNX-425]|uniref:hypothetical protein n=1 Tax=Streptomyces sp. MAR4 CNX-425 TaxID=3406343 RepID=UPI003B5146F4